MEENDNLSGTQAEENDNKTESSEGEKKKEGKISGFFKRMGKKLDDATYAMRLQSNFDTSHPKYTVYSGTGVFDASPEIAAEEHLDENYLLTLDDDEQIKAGNLIKTPNGEVLHIAATEKATLVVDFEGKTNDMPATKVVLGEAAQEVKVIKVDDKYYIV